ncbi:MAG: siroheme synthase CysG [Terracidiphilus sp.]|nr:siroheme synthase CysG [Terracidiphilus sp.]
MSLLPIFLSLRRQTVLLVGAGAVALTKAEQLLDAGARLRIVAPSAIEQIRSWAKEQKVDWQERSFRESDLDGCILAIAATGDPAVNALVYREATRRGILANSVDDPERCMFYSSSNLRRGALQIAVSTSGESPAFGQHLRDLIDAQLPVDLGERLDNLGEQRKEILQKLPGGPERTALLKRLAQRPFHDVRFGFGGQHSPQNDTVRRQQNVGTVYLVGAGPGDPDLLTIKALRLIQSADAILYDDLVSEEILSLANTEAMLIPVGKRCGTKSITQEEIHKHMIELAHAHEVVVRLKGGDPLLFGRAAEEMAALRQAQIPYEIVPGITTAFAAAAAAGCSLTSRTSASSVLLTTGHLAAQHRSERSLPTRVVYMPGADWQALSVKLQEEGLSPELPCAVVSHATRSSQRIVFSTLGGLGSVAGLPAPSLLLVGEAIKAPDTTHEKSCSDARHMVIFDK